MGNWEVNKPNLSEIPTDSDAISRNAAMETFNRWAEFKDYTHVERHILHAVVDEIRAMPSVTPKQRTGHWINVNEGKWNTIPAYKCSSCGANADLRDWSGESPYCPWCGAKMVEPQEREEQS